MPSPDQISQKQLDSLDDTDCYSSIWEQILSRSQCLPSNVNLWGGRGKGGRGLARRTLQPRDVVMEDVRLQYLGNSNPFLEGAIIKFLHSHVYALIGRNGCGKSTLLKRIQHQKIPGWSPQWSSLYIPPDFPQEFLQFSSLQVFESYYTSCETVSKSAAEYRIRDLEEEMDKLTMEGDRENMERLCEEISTLEETMAPKRDFSRLNEMKTCLRGLDINPDASCDTLAPSQQKELLLLVASVLGDMVNLVLLDEPARNLDVHGLLRLRRHIEASSSTVLMVSHDVDLINDVATDIIDMHNQKLHYYPGNYDSYCLMKEQRATHILQQSVVLEKKGEHLRKTLQNLKEQPTPKRKGGSKKKAKAIASQRKKMEWNKKSIGELEASSNVFPEKKGFTAAQRLKLSECMKTSPDKAVQFAFPQTTSEWGEALIVAYDVGYGIDKEAIRKQSEEYREKFATIDNDGNICIIKRDGFLFDCVDICIEEGSINCLLGPDNCSSFLLQILAKKLAPVEGTVYHPPGVRVGHCSSQIIGELISNADTSTTALVYLSQLYPHKSDNEIRGHLAQFGLSPTSQGKTPLCCLSGGEAFRFVLAKIMLEDFPVICIENPTASLDVESVQALAYGLQDWNGTIVMTSVDSFFLRMISDLRCFVILEDDGKLRKLPPEMQGIDAYLNNLFLD
ncbi:ABC transporter ATPase [Nitzschia inconspicua]|uniref:ABC transporter ATPase n=1 Tax=Nitzschia inconspicua TaxID=303405 RepID=A0A9K3L0Y9_9STRA|nr:ABC transporter ATPase [Nitzschia inconspicua]